MKVNVVNIQLLSILLFFFSCSNTDYGNSAAKSQSPQTKIVNVNAVKFKELIEDEGGIMLDVRTSDEIAQGHIPGASFIDFYDNDFEKKINLMQKDKAIYVYCRSGGRSSKASDILINNGFEKVYNLKGGIGAWKDENFETVIPDGEKDNKIKSMSAVDFENLIHTNSLVLIDFHTLWCAPCKKMAPIVDKLEDEWQGKAKVLRIDVDKSVEIAKNYSIKGVPVFIIYKEGIEVWRHTGLVEENVLREQVGIK